MRSLISIICFLGVLTNLIISVVSKFSIGTIFFQAFCTVLTFYMMLKILLGV